MYNISGLSKVMSNIDELTKDIKYISSNGIKKATRIVYRSSQIKVPVDKGPLRASAQVDYKEEGYQISSTISYNTKYALYVHEDLNKRHGPDRVPPGHKEAEAKYLENAVKENLPEIVQALRGE